MNPHMIVETSISGEKLQNVIRHKLAPALEGETVATGMICLLAYSILLMKNDVTPEQLKEAVMGTSGWILTYLAGLPGSTGDPMMMELAEAIDGPDFQQGDFDDFPIDEPIDKMKIN